MTTDKESLAKRWESGNTFDLELDDDTYEALRAIRELHRQDIYDALFLDDINAALAIKDPLYPRWPMKLLENFGSTERWHVTMNHPGDGMPFVGSSNTLSHAIMAALVRASEKMSPSSDTKGGE